MKLFPLYLLLAISLTSFAQSFQGTTLTIVVTDFDECHDMGLRDLREGEPDLDKVMEKTNAKNLGTGFVFLHEGEKYVVTCAHTLHKANGGSIFGYFENYDKKYEMTVIGEDRLNDLAVLAFVNQTDADLFEPVTLDTTPEIGDKVYNIGYWGLDSNFHSQTGKVQKTNADIDSDALTAGKMNLIETSVPLNQGYSGGVLCNMEGKVVGMSLKRHNSHEIYYYLQSNVVQRIVPQIIENGYLPRAFFGMVCAKPKDMNITEVIIEGVISDSPAAKYEDALVGSVLKSVNGATIETPFDILKVMESVKSGDTINLIVRKGDAPETEIEFQAVALSTLHLEEIGKEIQDRYPKIKWEWDRIFAEFKLPYNPRVQHYCLNNLADLGEIVCTFSLYGYIKIIHKNDKNEKSSTRIFIPKSNNSRSIYL